MRLFKTLSAIILLFTLTQLSVKSEEVLYNTLTKGIHLDATKYNINLNDYDIEVKHTFGNDIQLIETKEMDGLRFKATREGIVRFVLSSHTTKEVLDIVIDTIEVDGKWSVVKDTLGKKEVTSTNKTQFKMFFTSCENLPVYSGLIETKSGNKFNGRISFEGLDMDLGDTFSKNFKVKNGEFNIPLLPGKYIFTLTGINKDGKEIYQVYASSMGDSTDAHLFLNCGESKNENFVFDMKEKDNSDGNKVNISIKLVDQDNVEYSDYKITTYKSDNQYGEFFEKNSFNETNNESLSLSYGYYKFFIESNNKDFSPGWYSKLETDISENPEEAMVIGLVENSNGITLILNVENITAGTIGENSIIGQVVNEIEENEKLEKVFVYLYNSSDKLIDYQTTDMNGNFSFSKLPEGTYNLSFSKHGFIFETNEIILNDDLENLEFRLMPEGISSVENSIFNEVSLYPNPTSDFINIKLNENFLNGSITVIDVFGNQLIDANFSGNSTRVNLKELTAGSYIINLESDGKTRGFPFVKVK